MKDPQDYPPYLLAQSPEVLRQWARENRQRAQSIRFTACEQEDLTRWARELEALARLKEGK